MSSGEPPPERDPNRELREQEPGGKRGGVAPGPPDNPNVQMRRERRRPRGRGFLSLFRRYVLRRTD